MSGREEDPARRLRRFLSELKRRRVYRTAVAYLGVAFVVVEATDIMVPALLLPGWVTRVVVVLVVLGFPVALVLSWALDVGPGGIRRTGREGGGARRGGGEDTAPGGADARPSTRGGAAPDASDAGARREHADPETAATRPAGSGAASAAGATRRTGSPPSSRSPLTYLAAALLLAGVAYGAYAIVRPAVSGEPGGSGEVESLAVLPFADMSPGGDQEYLSHGIAEEIRGALGELDSLRVAARGASFAFGEVGVDPRTVGDSLGVDAVLEGSVRRSGDDLKISAELVGTGDAFSLWAGSFERSVEDLFAVQEEIARAIVAALKVEMGDAGGEEERLVERPTRDLEAYGLYLRGRHALDRRTGKGMQEAVRHFTAAVDRDPALAEAHAARGDARALQVAYGFRPGAELDRARRDVQRALELEPGMVQAHTSLGWILTARWDWAAGEAAFRRALELEPDHATAHQWLAWNLANRGRTGEAVRSVRRARELDSLSLIVSTDLGIMLHLDGRADAAAGRLGETLDRDPGFPVAHEWLGLVHLARGRAEEAVASLERALELSPVRSYQTVASLGLAHARAGDRAAARGVLDELSRRGRDEPVSPAALALVRLGLGETDRALSLLERASADRDPYLGTYLVPAASPALDPLRDDPRFDRVLARMGLPSDDASPAPPPDDPDPEAGRAAPVAGPEAALGGGPEASP